MQVKDLKVSSSQYLGFIVNNFGHEDVFQSVQVSTMYIKALIKSYLPEEKQQEAHEQMMRIFIEIIGKESTSNELKEELAASLSGFIFTEEHIERAKFWIEKRGVYT